MNRIQKPAGNITSLFSRQSEAYASELLDYLEEIIVAVAAAAENHEEMFYGYW